jgi:tetratricopeptide (TPR) repeat protein
MVVASMFFCFQLMGQANRLAEQYFQNGEYEKAGQLYLKLYNEQPMVGVYFDRYIDCLNKQKRYEEAEQVLRKEVLRQPKIVKNHVTLGDLYKTLDREEEAEAAYKRAIQEMPADLREITNLARAFLQTFNYKSTEEVYIKGAKLLKDPYVFATSLADLYRAMGNYPGMVQQYIYALLQNPRLLSQVQMMLNRYLPQSEFETLQSQLLEAIPQVEDNAALIELLAWSFSQQKDYRNAFRQLRALDLQLNENGNRVHRLALQAYQEGDYQASIEAFSYITEEKGTISPFYFESLQYLLAAKTELAKTSSGISNDQFREVELLYLTFLETHGRKSQLAPMIMELAHLQAVYLHDLDAAIKNLEDVVEMKGLRREVLAEAKLQLGDAYLMRGDHWDATLLYSQVDKDFKDDALGHEARFRNARLSYFSEDFEWAQAQFKVLKASTSKLIANDALDLSVFITDNLGLDTTNEVMALYAQAELLIFQNRHKEAFVKLDSLVQGFPNHTLEDDVLYLKAQVYKKEGAYEKATVALERIATEYKEDIRADNAIFELGELYEGPLKDKEKAMAYYERIFLEYSGSTYAVEARKAYRRLRGDDVQ